MRVVVIGGGFGGLASAVRLAKLGHDVTLVEAADGLGGALGAVTQDGFSWDAGPTSTLMPAVIRDLFRKSGRPLEREVDLVPLDVVREHRFGDGSRLVVPAGSRGAQTQALGEQWTAYVDSLAETWEILRRDYFEQPWDRDVASRALNAVLDGRETLQRRLTRTFKDERLRSVAAHPFVADGHDLRNVPAWAGVTAYLERSFGAWTVPGGMHLLRDALAARLATRGVATLLSTTVEDLVLRNGRVAAVRTTGGEIDADAVVVAIDPRRLPSLSSYVARSLPAIPPTVAHVGVAGDLPDLPAELVLHGVAKRGEPTLIVRGGGSAPEGASAWTIHGRGNLGEDLLLAVARHRIDLRSDVVTRIDRSPQDLVEAWGGSPLGVAWRGRSTVRGRQGPRTPLPGVYAAGAHANPGSGLAYVGLSAALVAQAIGPD